MKTKNVIKLLLLTVLLCVAGTWYYFEVYSKQMTPIENGENNGIIQEETLVNGETITSGIREMGELNTAEYYFSRTESVENSKELDLSKFKRELMETGHANVEFCKNPKWRDHWEFKKIAN